MNDCGLTIRTELGSIVGGGFTLESALTRWVNGNGDSVR